MYCADEVSCGEQTHQKLTVTQLYGYTEEPKFTANSSANHSLQRIISEEQLLQMDVACHITTGKESHLYSRNVLDANILGNEQIPPNTSHQEPIFTVFSVSLPLGSQQAFWNKCQGKHQTKARTVN